MPDLIHGFPSLLAAFLASLVECVEALTVVLAVGLTRGWSGALAGAALALALLAALVLAFGPGLARIPLHDLQLMVGVLLLLFGLRWLRKAILRSAGKIPMRDEAAAFARSTASLGAAVRRGGGWDRVAIVAAFQIVMLEGAEVVFIVIAVGAAGGLLRPAAIGALAALVVVVLLGAALGRPLSRIPENALKFAVGCLLSAFGTFWTGEAIGVAWPGADWSLPALIACFLALALALVAIKRVAPAGHSA